MGAAILKPDTDQILLKFDISRYKLFIAGHITLELSLFMNITV